MQTNVKCELTYASKQGLDALADALGIQMIKEKLDAAFHNFTATREQHENSLGNDHVI